MEKSYMPLSDVRKTMSVKWYRCPIESSTLRKLSRRSDLQGWFQAGGHLTLFIFTASLAYYFWDVKNWSGFVIMLFVHGTIGNFFSGVAPHELGHGTVFKTKWLNKFFMYFFSLLSWWNPFDYASSHTYHHRYTQYADGDRENLFPLDPHLGPIFLLQIFTLNIFSKPGRTFGKGGLLSTIYLTFRSSLGLVGSIEIPSQEWLQALHEDQPTEHRKSMWWSRLQLIFHGSVLVYSIWIGQWALPFLINFFAFTANWLGFFVGMTQHCGLREDVSDFRKCVRSIKLNPFVSFLYWRMNWHTEHHMYAGVPCYNLKKLSQAIAHDMPEPRTLIGAWREMLEIRRQQMRTPNYQFDTPLPASANKILMGNTDELASSIGELAPEGLR